MGWDINESLVAELLAEEVGGVQTRMQAVAVLQHCSLRDMTLFEFFAKWQVDGMRLIPAQLPPGVEVSFDPSPPAAAAFSEGEFPAQSSGADVVGCSGLPTEMPVWKHDKWLACVRGADRLEELRKHIAEVIASGEGRYQAWSGSVDYLVNLQDKEAKLARVVEPVLTLGMVADDDEDNDESFFDQHEPCDDLDQPDDDDVNVPAPVITPPSSAEQADIAAVLANPKAAAAADVPRKDGQGRVLASDATLAELYACGERLGINKVAAQELACKQFKLRSIDDLPEVLAQKVIAKMKAQAAAA